MANPTQTVDNLMKVSVKVRPGTISSDDHRDIPFVFIYGVGPAGITPFEKALFGKGIGDRVQFDMMFSDYRETIGHLEAPLREQTGIRSPASLDVTVTGIVRATDRDVVKAMAAGGSCGDCGCGCGGH
ncbi:hypothetical protein DSCA_14180 [Desulfosarcina alkanivorans]|jgi:hypothetical protein|uniref:Uncharacterized protein n=1 Tax=Desulfosarcina alkanivorans TaxID=571177 RepID=A0A5K7YEK1_9BACT|nr:hypothetical protein [Desulfosarcina alkanivorans]BBO67488.1 hypothetical protein DSCA_14180 [Desulfosarcina alkanivorans]